MLCLIIFCRLSRIVPRGAAKELGVINKNFNRVRVRGGVRGTFEPNQEVGACIHSLGF